MILSMTGFANTTCTITSTTGTTAQISFVVKTVNSRYFEAICKLPYTLQVLETDLINLFRAHFIRGKVTCIVHCSDQTIFRGPIEPSLPAIKSYLQAAHHVQKECQVPGEITISDLIKMPDLFSSIEISLDDTIKNLVMETASQACQKLNKTRQVEGAGLAQDIKKRSTNIQANMQDLEQRSSVNFEVRKQKVLQELQSLEHTKEADIIRHHLNAELHKTAINEELTRFAVHMQALQSLLESSEHEHGRRIDFLLQELGREINTIASKSDDANIGALAVNVKVELEKIREQAQNIV